MRLSGALKQKYSTLAKGRPTIGISFCSSGGSYSAQKTAPLMLWNGILRRKDIFRVNVQYGPKGYELDRVCRESGYQLYRDDIDQMRDLDAAAAQLCALDLLISVSNATVHLAGGLGVRVFALVPRRIALIWTLPFGIVSVWYPSVRIIRQRDPGDWHSAFVEMERYLSSWVGRYVHKPASVQVSIR
ncbi:MAG: hypothetical protein MN733_21545 [Nitrososphaera sp.]|nr:hypothetical protein [Nitrososphaera sp.]